MDHHTGHIMTLANSIIGVSVLAMPYCFKECGIILSILMLFASSIISRLACHFLLKSAIIARRKTFEFLAFHAFGPLGKFIIEIGLIGFLLGTCIAFFVVMGDLGPEIISKMTGTKVTSTLRTSILMALALFCVLPLGLLRNVDSLNGVSKATIGFYCCLVLKIIVESLPRFFSENWLEKVELWRTAGILQCLPIFSMALFCQTQLFEIYQAVPNASLEKMNNIIRVAVNICTFVYIFVGMFGYIAFFQQTFTGNILMSFRPSIMSDVMKIGFILSVAFSFPLVIFPCRASLYSLLYKNTYPIHEGSSNNYIPEGKFKTITFIIVFISLVTGVLIPNIELVLGLVGSTIGVMICVLFPVACFISMSPKNTNERILAQLMLFVGVVVMVLGTYANLYAIEKINYTTEKTPKLEPLNFENINIEKKDVFNVPITNQPAAELNEKKPDLNKIVVPFKQDSIKEVRLEPPQPVEPAQPIEPVKEIRHEPPHPVEPAENPSKTKNVPEIKKVEVSTVEAQKNQHEPNVQIKSNENKESKKDVDNKLVLNKNLEEKIEKRNNLVEISTNIIVPKQKPLPPQSGKDEVDIEAIKKEETELKEQEKEKLKDVVKNQDLIDTLQKQNQVQQELVKQQKELIEVIKQQQQALEIEKQKKEIEKLRAVKHIENIAKQAIESLSIKSIVDEPKVKSVDRNLDNEANRGIPANPAPLSYQLGLNQNKISNNTNVGYNLVKFIESENPKKLIPIPVALRDNFSTLNRNKELNNNTPIELKKNGMKIQVPVEFLNKKDTHQNIVKESEIKIDPIKVGKSLEELPKAKDNNIEKVLIPAEQSVVKTINDNKTLVENQPEPIKQDILSQQNIVRKKRELPIPNKDVSDANAKVCDKNDNRISTGSTLIDKIILSDLSLVPNGLTNLHVDNSGLSVKNVKSDFKLADFNSKK